MAQLISTTSVSELNFLCKKSGSLDKDYNEAYQQLLSLLGEELIGMFAKPEFKGNDKVNWYTDYDGNIYPLSKAADTIEHPYELLEEQANALYLKILEITSNNDERKKYFDLLDKCLTVESANHIYLVISPDGDKRFVLTSWGSNSKGKVNILASVTDVKKVDIVVRITQSGKPLVNKEISVKVDNAVLQLTSDEQGLIYLKDMDLLGEFSVLQRDSEKIIKQRKYIVDKQKFNFEVKGNTIPKLQIKVVDKVGKPLPLVNIEVQIGDKVSQYQTNEKGIIELNDVPIGSRLIVSQPITPAKKITKSFSISSGDINEVVFKGEKLSGNFLVIKVLDANGETFPEAEMEIIYGDQKIRKTANENGLVIINDLPLNSEVLIRQIVDGLPSFQQKINYTGEVKEITFRSHAVRKKQKNITIRLFGGREQPIQNLSIRLVNGYNWHYAITDKDGVAVFENINCAEPTKIEIRYRGRQIVQDLDCDETTDFTFKFETQSVKWPLYLIIALVLVAAVVLGIKFLASNGGKENKQPAGREDTGQVVQAAPVVEQVKPVNVKLYVADYFDHSLVSGFRIIADSSLLKKNAADSGYVVLGIKPDTQVTVTIIAENYDTAKFTVKPVEADTVYLKRLNLLVANDTVCNSYIFSKPTVRYYVQTFRFDTKVQSFAFRFIKRYVSDQVWIYRGDKEHATDKKLVWQYTGVMPDTLYTRIQLTQPDSLITIKIKAGEPNTPSWRFKIYCK